MWPSNAVVCHKTFSSGYIEILEDDVVARLLSSRIPVRKQIDHEIPVHNAGSMEPELITNDGSLMFIAIIEMLFLAPATLHPQP